ncbi:MAG: hypothetical protein PQJ60_01445, partial [Spirochaetales bacterium]|nr:hypothetical protein [Spirochaetales bacterium]
EDYTQLNEKFLDEGGEGRALYIPTADNMIQSHSGVATPSWNENPREEGFEKPTGDFHIYNSLRDTIFHHEGSIPEISYYMRYLQYLLDRGLSTNILRYGAVFSADEIIYHREYEGQEARQDFNLALMDVQEDRESRDTIGLFTSYRPATVPSPNRLVPQRLFTPYGLSQWEAYTDMDRFDWSRYGVIFTSQSAGSYLNLLQEGDLFDCRSLNDLMLSSLENSYYLNPFDFVNDGNPYLKWAKTRVSSPDWLWYLQSQGIDRNGFDFDMGFGMAVSYASSRLDLPPYKMAAARGELLVDFNSLLRMEKFFTPDNPQLFSARANPISPYNNLPVLHGEIRKGDSENIWQVAKSGMLRVTGDTPYQFKISLSGRGTNKMHVKVRFFDEEMTELGVTYVMAPSEEISFDGMTLYGEYVSPSASRYMRIDLLSYQRPEQKVFWWIHDIQILDLKQYSLPNRIGMNRRAEQAGEVKLFMRAFRSPKGGELLLTVNDGPTLSVDTLSSGSGMEWFDLGTIFLREGENRITLENRSGFNGVNTLVLIPEEEYDTLAFPFRRVSDRGIQFFTAEAEADFNYEGNIQTRRSYPALHSGRGIRSDRGRLSLEFEILQDGYYDWSIFSSFPQESRGTITLIIRDGEGREIYERAFTREDLEGDSLRTGEVVYDELLYKDFPRRLTDPDFRLDRYGPLSKEKIPLIAGKYTMEILLDSAVPSLASLGRIRLFDPSQVRIPYFLEDIFQENCSDCTHITEDMSARSVRDSLLTITYDPTCSCDWYVYSTPRIEVREGREYWVGFTARSENLVRRHMKVLFLNEEQEIVGTQFINEVEEQFKIDFNDYEQIFTIPEGAVGMFFQIWGRGDKVLESTFQMKDLRLIPLDRMVLVDSVMMEENVQPPEEPVKDEYLMVSAESYSNQWQPSSPAAQ